MALWQSLRDKNAPIQEPPHHASGPEDLQRLDAAVVT